MIRNHSNYAEQFCDWLIEDGYTTCFFVAGGNNMHLLNAARSRFQCVAVVHEVSAAIATEYFNASATSSRAFTLVTAGPGLTNAITGIAGAWLESRELLIVGGQVKTTDLMSGGLRQRGIQEIDGISLVESITKRSVRLVQPLSQDEVLRLTECSRSGRKAPVFIEFCLDVQGAPPRLENPKSEQVGDAAISDNSELSGALAVISEGFSSASRPVILIGGGVSRESARGAQGWLDAAGIPVLTTWNGADRYASDRPMWFGRSDTWGMRSANLIIQQSDFILALGARLSLQQTGFNWQAFAPSARIAHVNNDDAELEKGHPYRTVPIKFDANKVLNSLTQFPKYEFDEWNTYCKVIKDSLPLSEDVNRERVRDSTDGDFLNPFDFAIKLSALSGIEDQIVPCSSGGAFTVMMQAFLNKTGQIMLTNKALASMGYGLAGAIGVAMASEKRTVLVEGDGGFSQNLQDIATLKVRNLNVKIFIFSNRGYASIRMTQKNYFGGEYLGCDEESGLGFPDWPLLFNSFGIDGMVLPQNFTDDDEFRDLWNSQKPTYFIVKVAPDQTYFPKISSRITESGGMESNPLHLMDPIENVPSNLLRFIPNQQGS